MHQPALKNPSLTVPQIKRALRKIERESTTGGTGPTILRMTSKPVAVLVDGGYIGQVELQSASDIQTAFMALAGALFIKSPSMEKIDRSHGPSFAAHTVGAISRYQEWARYWSDRAKRGDRTLQVVIAAVIDERSFSAIETDEGFRHGAAKRALIGGLRDYAARAGWCTKTTANRWIDQASRTFRARIAESVFF